MYKVTLPREFPYEQRIRAGIVVNKVHGYEGELSGEQLKVIESDDLLSVQKIQMEAPAKSAKDVPKPAPDKK